MMKVFSVINKTLSKFHPKRTFCTIETCTKLEDWQYVSKINELLNKGDINTAFNFLIKSHLDGKILDMQVFRNMHMKMVDQQFDISYHQLMYKLYREHFRPHLLMEQLIRSMVMSNDPEITKLVEQDCQSFGLSMPLDLEQSFNDQFPNGQKEGQNKQRPNIHTEQSKTKQLSLKGEDLQQLQNILSKLAGNNSKVTIHELEIQYNYDDYFDGAYSQSIESGDELDNTQNYMSRKVKIGKIEIVSQSQPDMKPQQ